MTLYDRSISKLVLWGSAPPAFMSGLLLSVTINIFTSLLLIKPEDWPLNGRGLLLGSITLLLSATGFAILAAVIQPIKSRSDEALRERYRRILKEERERSDEEYIWNEMLNIEASSRKTVRLILGVTLVSLMLVLFGFTFYATSLTALVTS